MGIVFGVLEHDVRQSADLGRRHYGWDSELAQNDLLLCDAPHSAVTLPQREFRRERGPVTGMWGYREALEGPSR